MSNMSKKKRKRLLANNPVCSMCNVSLSSTHPGSGKKRPDNFANVIKTESGKYTLICDKCNTERAKQLNIQRLEKLPLSTKLKYLFYRFRQLFKTTYIHPSKKPAVIQK